MHYSTVQPIEPIITVNCSVNCKGAPRCSPWLMISRVDECDAVLYALKGILGASVALFTCSIFSAHSTSTMGYEVPEIGKN